MTSRDGEKFTGLIAVQNFFKRGEVSATVKENGTIQFVVTKDLSGESSDVVGLVNFQGRVRGERLSLAARGTVGTQRIDSLLLERKRPEKEKPEIEKPAAKKP